MKEKHFFYFFSFRGKAYRIHISKSTEKKLRKAGGYHIRYRGEISLKGRGKQPTFWLLGKTGFDKKLPDLLSDDDFELSKIFFNWFLTLFLFDFK